MQIVETQVSHAGSSAGPLEQTVCAHEVTDVRSQHEGFCAQIDVTHGSQPLASAEPV